MYIPEGYGTVFPYIFASQAGEYLEFLVAGLGASELGRTTAPDGSVANARMRIGTTSFMVSQAGDQYLPSSAAFYLYVEDADAACARAVEHGAQLIHEPKDMVYGDRQGGVTDPSGNVWWISTRLQHEAYDA